MYISLVGYVIFPLGILLFFLPGEALLCATIAMSGFTGTSLCVIGGVSLQPSYYLATLWFVQLIIRRKFDLVLPSRDIFIPMGLFLSIATISLLMPIFLEDKVTVMNVEGQIEKLHFSSSNVTQLLYLIFVVTFFFVLSAYMNTNQGMRALVFKAYICGVVLVCAVTFYQIIAYKFDIPFDPIFRTALVRDNIVESAGILIYWDKRISGPCLEASMLAYYIVPALPLCSKISSWKIRYTIMACLVFIGVLTLSSTFLVGVVFWIILELLVSFLKKHSLYFSERNLRHVAYLLVILLFVFLLCNYFFNIVQILDNGIQAFVLKLKRENTSGQERSETFELLIEAFYSSPVLGVGFGSTRGKDLFSTWLANVGVLGMSILAVFLFGISKNAIYMKEREYLIATLLLWFCMFISVPEPYNLFVWILMALCNNECRHGRRLERKRYLVYNNQHIVMLD